MAKSKEPDKPKRKPPRKSKGIKLFGRHIKTKPAMAGMGAKWIGGKVAAWLPEGPTWTKIKLVPDSLGLAVAGVVIKDDTVTSAGVGAVGGAVLGIAL